MSVPGAPPVRRSALEAIHARLAARWRSDTERWPVGYGSEAAEMAAVREGIGLAEPGPFEKLMVRGPSTLVDLRWLGLASVAGDLEPARSVDGTTAFVIAEDEAVLLRQAGAGAPPGRAPTVATESLAEIAGRLRSAGPSVVDVGSGLTVFRLVGRRLPSLLQELCPVDLSAGAVPNLRIVQAPVVGCRMVFARQDVADLPGFTFLVVRDEAAFVWEAMTELGAAHGLRPVGPATLDRLAAASGSPSGATR